MNAPTVTAKRVARPRHAAVVAGSRAAAARRPTPPGQVVSGSASAGAPAPTVAARGAPPQRLVGKSRGLTAWVLRAVAVIGLCAYAAHSLIGLGGHGLDGFFEDWVFNGLLLAGSALCLLRAVWAKLERAAWSAL